MTLASVSSGFQSLVEMQTSRLQVWTTRRFVQLILLFMMTGERHLPTCLQPLLE